MGNCCSTCFKPRKNKRKRKSSDTSNTSGRSSSSSFPSEGEFAEATISEPSSPFRSEATPSAERSGDCFPGRGFVKTDVKPIWVERHEEKLNIQRRREKFAKERRQRYGWAGRAEDGNAESSTDEEEGANVMVSNRRYTGAVPRLRKKDSTRQPRYKDELMLTDDIDRIVEQEIPDEQDLNRACAASSSSGAAQSSNRGKYFKIIFISTYIITLQSETDGLTQVSGRFLH